MTVSLFSKPAGSTIDLIVEGAIVSDKNTKKLEELGEVIKVDALKKWSSYHIKISLRDKRDIFVPRDVPAYSDIIGITHGSARFPAKISTNSAGYER